MIDLRKRITDEFEMMVKGDYQSFRKTLKRDFCMQHENEIHKMNKDQLVALYKKLDTMRY